MAYDLLVGDLPLEERLTPDRGIERQRHGLAGGSQIVGEPCCRFALSGVAFDGDELKRIRTTSSTKRLRSIDGDIERLRDPEAGTGSGTAMRTAGCRAPTAP